MAFAQELPGAPTLARLLEEALGIRTAGPAPLSAGLQKPELIFLVAGAQVNLTVYTEEQPYAACRQRCRPAREKLQPAGPSLSHSIALLRSSELFAVSLGCS